MEKRNSDLIVIASAKALAGKESALEQALLEVATPTRKHPGCISFSLFHSLDDPTVMIGFERWVSKEEHDQHLRSEHVQKLFSKMGGILAEPPKIFSYEVTDE